MLYCFCCRRLRSGRGCRCMDAAASFLLSILAGVISYYICKWLDEWKKKK
ncbi:MAG: molybdenum cofactor biosynthesis protein MoaD [Coriobacteriaceae bacterium]|nr:molybdenum cofactor biosynthesis protein MoaD [Coriobacteriaceae bacterium]